jgi:hypothetical protein
LQAALGNQIVTEAHAVAAGFLEFMANPLEGCAASRV